MKFIEETIAKDLHSKIKNELKKKRISADNEVSGAGVHWNCIVKNPTRIFDIYCAGGPEYIFNLKDNSGVDKNGRTESIDSLLSSIVDWMSNKEFSGFYEKYEFIEKDKRSLQAIINRFRKQSEDIKNKVDYRIEHLGSDIFKAWLSSGDRSCSINFYGKNLEPDFDFYWDNAYLFTHQSSDYENMGGIVEHWLVKNEKPSAIKKEFPFIEISKLASYYENGEGIEGEFILSWEDIAEFYKEIDIDNTSEILQFITDIRDRGYHKQLRAGQSMATLVISRSRRHGLREGQPFISIIFYKNCMNIKYHNNHEESFSIPKIDFNEQVINIVEKLKDNPID